MSAGSVNFVLLNMDYVRKIEDDFSRLELNLGATVENYRYFRTLLDPKTKLLVLVKANAYGHGAVEFASMMQRAGADYLAVAYPVEGLELRRNGISLPILVLTAGTDFFPEIIFCSIYSSIISNNSFIFFSIIWPMIYC